MRTFTSYSNHDPVARQLVEELHTIQNNPLKYRDQMRQIGKHLGAGVAPQLDKGLENDICVVCTVEDADFLGRGLIEELEQRGFGSRLHLICLWNDKISKNGVSLSPITRQYKEDFDPKHSTFVVVKAIISGACVVKTNLTRAISFADPSEIFVASPVMLVGAEDRLAQEFPDAISSKFKFVHFVTDSEKAADGESVLPGIGGSLYELLGLGNRTEKNRYVPDIVKERRKKFFPAATTA
ncbi:hypothetical protein F2P45_26255 [Massilia sp. CCM 8733]|uniref:TIR domain-containing protein n=1 Tax=Massilia mucilaginosa TaxID=2609282 RepID=A0ABX0NZP5_9BURK|nr:hypothetical protein [Massilia mucilaginosa]NHZ92483.1 hypothetical protein [Massilia mucilaginosa]